ncbi:membrane or secreted protein [Robertkochia aurantiaca]|uniref:membrane or secreted protein n=1 Tax=Robertkochia aurantiaca TaxID=2873700 RepID=UPI001CCF71DB|nr:membrane or secreted protein [Robertkochia sp. 3YJGBD-33]
MRLISYITLVLIIGNSLYAQSILGAWETIITNPDNEQVRMVVIFTEGYQSAAYYKAEGGEFIGTNGGGWWLENNTMTEVVEFDSSQPQRVGDSISFTIELSENIMKIPEANMELKRIDDASGSDLAGAWLISGRKRDGEIVMREVDQPRKTMKILSDTRFQWIAYNTETKEFMGTGGGTYTTENNTYTENIEFFSRDNSRVGASLEFKYEIIDGNWHHSGMSSKGDPIYEIWVPRSLPREK